MSLLNFDAPTTATVVVPAATAVASTSRRHLASSGEWGWEELRDYVVTEIESRFGAFPRDPLKEKGIFSGFVNRWGADAERIARAAFEVHGGMWRSAPISVYRFAVRSDPFFAQVIRQSL